MKNPKVALAFLLVVLIAAFIIVQPVAAQGEIIPVTANPDKLDFTICYPEGEASQQIELKNENNFPLQMQAIYQNIPYYTGVVVDPYDASLDPNSILPVTIHVSAKPYGGGPSIPFGEYDGTAIFDFSPGSVIGVPVHYSIVACNPSPEFPVASGTSVPFVSVGLIGGLVCLIFLIKIK
jgi:hypothetical protein